MYCKIFTSQPVYDGMTEMNIACDNAMVTDGWICLYRGEQFVASFDMTTINGWVLIDSIADTPQTEVGYCNECRWFKDKQVCGRCRSRNLFAKADTPQTDCDTCKYGQDKHRYAHICNECGVGINNYTPQTDCDKCIWNVCNYNTVEWDADTLQTDCEACELDGKADVCKICRVSNYEPQTDCGWK